MSFCAQFLEFHPLISVRLRRAILSSVAALAMSGLAAPAMARDIIDMSGRTVAVPDTIHKIYAMTHAFALITAVAPDLVAGFASPRAPNPKTIGFLPPVMRSLPDLGGGGNVNVEKLKAIGVDVALGWASTGEAYPAAQLERGEIPVVDIDVDRLADYPATLRFLGSLTGRQARGEALAHDLETIIGRLKDKLGDLPPAEKPRVYYAESADGLTSQCGNADRAEVITYAGGSNVLSCDNLSTMGDNYPTDVEKVVALDPDVIVARFGQAAAMIRTDPRWQSIKAVKTGKVYAVPAYPYNWFDRPPSFMRALGAEWLAGLLHPDLYPVDIRAEAKGFFTQFYAYDLSEADLDGLLAQ